MTAARLLCYIYAYSRGGIDDGRRDPRACDRAGAARTWRKPDLRQELSARVGRLRVRRQPCGCARAL